MRLWPRKCTFKRIYVDVVQIVIVFKCFELCFSWSPEDLSCLPAKTLLQVFWKSQTFKGELLTGTGPVVCRSFLDPQAAEKQVKLSLTLHLKKKQNPKGNTQLLCYFKTSDVKWSRLIAINSEQLDLVRDVFSLNLLSCFFILHKFMKSLFVVL